MAEYLELEKVLDDKNIITVQTREYGSIEVIPVDTITDIELADAKPVKRGEWCPPLMGQGKCDTYCGRCFGKIMRNSTGLFEETPFCPHCGADMRKEW